MTIEKRLSKLEQRSEPPPMSAADEAYIQQLSRDVCIANGWDPDNQPKSPKMTEADYIAELQRVACTPRSDC